MAALIAGAAPEAAAAQSTLEHAGSPDLAVTAGVVALGPDPPVLLKGYTHALATATPDAGWAAAPVGPATNRRAGWCLPQSTLDMWAVGGGKATAYLRAATNLLEPSMASPTLANMLAAWGTCGRLPPPKGCGNEGGCSPPPTGRPWVWG